MGSLERALDFQGSFAFACVHSGARSGFTRARIGVADFVFVSRRFTRARLGISPGSFGLAWVHSGAPRCCREHSGSLGFTRVPIGVSGFAWVHSGAQMCRRVNSVSRVFTWARVGFASFTLIR